MAASHLSREFLGLLRECADSKYFEAELLLLRL
jgi:hypothetical protein